jgi:hypothetical protein
VSSNRLYSTQGLKTNEFNNLGSAQLTKFAEPRPITLTNRKTEFLMP